PRRTRSDFVLGRVPLAIAEAGGRVSIGYIEPRVPLVLSEIVFVSLIALTAGAITYAEARRRRAKKLRVLQPTIASARTYLESFGAKVRLTGDDLIHVESITGRLARYCPLDAVIAPGKPERSHFAKLLSRTNSNVSDSAGLLFYGDTPDAAALNEIVGARLN